MSTPAPLDLVLLARTKILTAVLGAGGLALAAAGSLWYASSSQGPRYDYVTNIEPILIDYCFDCHGDGSDKGGVALDDFEALEQHFTNLALWEGVYSSVDEALMPPGEKPQPTDEERAKIVAWIEDRVFHLDPDNPDPGRVTLRRLNREEYNNTVRDLFGEDLRPADAFPADDSGYGFDNVGDVLTLSPALFERYLKTGGEVLDALMVTEPPKPETRTVDEGKFKGRSKGRSDGSGGLASNGTVGARLRIEEAGKYRIAVLAGGSPAKNEWPIMRVKVENGPQKDFRVDVPSNRGKEYVIETTLTPGERWLDMSFMNDLYDPKAKDPKQRDRNLMARRVRVVGPLDPPEPALQPAHRRILAAAHPDARHEAFRPSSFDGLENMDNGDGRLSSEGTVGVVSRVEKAGRYRVVVQASGTPGGGEWPRMRVEVPGTGRKEFAVERAEKRPGDFELELDLKPGDAPVHVSFLNDFYDEKAKDPGQRDRNLVVHGIQVIGPVSKLSEQEQAKQFVESWGRRLYRRPLDEQEVEELIGFFEKGRKAGGDRFDAGAKMALRVMLVSPRFLFRGEVQPEPDNPERVHDIDEFALATRLSYFLWSSTPDDELIDLAEAGKLRKNLDRQIDRMLLDRRARALTRNFGGQWLQLRNLDLVAPDKKRFKSWNDDLKQAMRRESEMFFDAIVRENRSVLEFIDADYTYLNDTLAEHYGIGGVDGPVFQRVSLSGEHLAQRGGVLGQASVLTITSNPTRTSAVNRGNWVLENILGTPPPPAPADVPSLEEAAKEGGEKPRTLREQLEIHRETPVCNSCHARMDPIGFGLENFDAIGGWREKENGHPIDASGELFTGEAFNGPEELRRIILEEKRQSFLTHLAEVMLTYSLGRGPEFYDKSAIARIVEETEAGEYKMHALIRAVVDSIPFQKRRGDQAGLEIES